MPPPPMPPFSWVDEGGDEGDGDDPYPTTTIGGGGVEDSELEGGDDCGSSSPSRFGGRGER